MPSQGLQGVREVPVEIYNLPSLRLKPGSRTNRSDNAEPELDRSSRGCLLWRLSPECLTWLELRAAPLPVAAAAVRYAAAAGKYVGRAPDTASPASSDSGRDETAIQIPLSASKSVHAFRHP